MEPKGRARDSLASRWKWLFAHTGHIHIITGKFGHVSSKIICWVARNFYIIGQKIYLKLQIVCHESHDQYYYYKFFEIIKIFLEVSPHDFQ